METKKRESRGKTIQEAAQAVKRFMVWQNNYAQLQRLDYDEEGEFEEKFTAVKRAFMLGAAGVAADVFSIAPSQENLFMKNVVGVYHGLSEPEAEIEEMHRAAATEEDACEVGGAGMMHFLAYGPEDDNRVLLAAIMGWHPDFDETTN